MTSSSRTLFRWLLVLAAIVAGPPAMAVSVSSITMPDTGLGARPEALRLDPAAKRASLLQLGPADATEIEKVRQANSSSTSKRLQIGIGREVLEKAASHSRSLGWERVPGGLAAHWEVASTGAHAMRIGLVAERLSTRTQIRFAGRLAAGTVYGPFSVGDIPVNGDTYWSPVLEGESAIVEIFIPDGGQPGEVALAVARVSHLFASPADRDVESLAKASQACEVDLICRSAGDAALASTGRAVARMTYSDGVGAGTYLCTGTLLNDSRSSLTPYFHSANHCISTQASASTLTTHWFYDRTGCGSGTTSPNYVQVAGGATLLYANAASDALLLRLNSAPPAAAVFSGWDAATLSTGTAMTAVHHPAGDLKKVSLASMGGFGSPFDASTSFIIAAWNSTATGVTEGGSSGSGIFTAFGQPATEYRFRGGLYGGPSSCTATGADLRDYYSRFDQVYPSIAQYLNPGASACSYALSPTSITVGPNAASGSVSVTTSSGCTWSVTSNASWLSSASSGSGGGTAAFAVAANSGAARVGTLTIAGQSFTVSQQATANSGTNLVSNPGFESGTAGWSQSATGEFPIIYQDAARAHSGTWYAWLGGYDSGTDTMYKAVTIPAGATQATLQFWYWIVTNESSTTSAFDVLTVSIASPETGAGLATVATLSNLDRTSGWVQSPRYDLSAFAGRTVLLVFSAKTDSSDITNFFIDDIALTATSPATPSSTNYTALWWNPAESGWGVNFNHQGNIVFGTLFTYDATGQPLWLVLANGAMQADGVTFTGTLYRTTGPPFNAVPFTPITEANLTQVGTMTVSFSSVNTATLSYTVNGTPVTKSIQRQVYGTRAATCLPSSGSRSSATNYQDLWWNAAESGWGINITHQDNTLFATLFTYDSTGRGLWLVMSAGQRQADGSYLGDLFRTTGPVFNASPFTPITGANVATVGTMRLRFTDGERATLTYTVNGTPVTKAITRQEFSSPVPLCSS